MLSNNFTEVSTHKNTTTRVEGRPHNGWSDKDEEDKCNGNKKQARNGQRMLRMEDDCSGSQCFRRRRRKRRRQSAHKNKTSPCILFYNNNNNNNTKKLLTT